MCIYIISAPEFHGRLWSKDFEANKAVWFLVGYPDTEYIWALFAGRIYSSFQSSWSRPYMEQVKKKVTARTRAKLAKNKKKAEKAGMPIVIKSVSKTGKLCVLGT